MPINPHIRSNNFTVVAYIFIALTYLLNVGLVGNTLLNSSGHNTLLNPLLQPLIVWQLQHPYISLAISLLLILLGALLTMRISIRFNLYNTASHIPSVVYPAIISALITPAQIIIAPLVALLSMLALFKFYDAYNSPRSTHKIFSALFWCGVVGFIYPSTIVLSLLLFIAMTTFDREVYEFFVGLVALFTPLLIALHIGWVMGHSIPEMIRWQRELIFSHDYAIYEHLPQVGFIAITTLGVLYGATRIETISIALVSRTRIIFAVAMSLILTLTLALPSFLPTHFVAAAAPASIAISATLLTMRDKWATITYIAYLIIVSFVGLSDDIFRLFNN